MDLHDTLEGQVALVSGANRGIGAHIAAGLARLGATVHAGTRRLEALEGVKEQEPRIRPVRLDVEDEASIKSAVATASKDGLDILVNNAGVGDWRGVTLQNVDVGLMDKVLAVNLRGPLLLTQAALPHLLAREGPRVVNISSGMGALGEGMSGSAPTYRVTKAGLNALTVYLHGEYGPRGLISASVCPGWVATQMGGTNAPREPEKGAETPLWAARFRDVAQGGRFWRDKKPIDW